MNLQIEEVAYHRNGISGEGFYVVLFRFVEDVKIAAESRPMMAVLFSAPGQCAVLDREQSRRGNIAFAVGNSWRGDRFEPALREAIAEFEASLSPKT